MHIVGSNVLLKYGADGALEMIEETSNPIQLEHTGQQHKYYENLKEDIRRNQRIEYR